MVDFLQTKQTQVWQENYTLPATDEINGFQERELVPPTQHKENKTII